MEAFHNSYIERDAVFYSIIEKARVYNGPQPFTIASILTTVKWEVNTGQVTCEGMLRVGTVDRYTCVYSSLMITSISGSSFP
jgi:hypothetical protein